MVEVLHILYEYNVGVKAVHRKGAHRKPNQIYRNFAMTFIIAEHCVHQLLGQLIPSPRPFTVRLGNRLSVLHVNLRGLLTDSGMYLLPPTRSLSHLFMCRCLSPSYFLI